MEMASIEKVLQWLRSSIIHTGSLRVHPSTFRMVPIIPEPGVLARYQKVLHPSGGLFLTWLPNPMDPP